MSAEDLPDEAVVRGRGEEDEFYKRVHYDADEMSEQAEPGPVYFDKTNGVQQQVPEQCGH